MLYHHSRKGYGISRGIWLRHRCVLLCGHSWIRENHERRCIYLFYSIMDAHRFISWVGIPHVAVMGMDWKEMNIRTQWIQVINHLTWLVNLINNRCDKKQIHVAPVLPAAWFSWLILKMANFLPTFAYNTIFAMLPPCVPVLYNVHKLLQIKGIDGCPFCRQDEEISSRIL